MNNTSDSTRSGMVLWCGPEQHELLAEVVQLLGQKVRLLAVGGPRHANTARLARRLGHDPADDLRATLVQHTPSLLVLGAQAGVGPAEVMAAVEQNIQVVSLVPIGDSVSDLAEFQARAHRDDRGLERLDRQCQLLGAMTSTPGFDAAASTREMLGPPRVIQANWTGPAAMASVATRLYDLWYTLLALCDLPERVSAAFTGHALDDPDLGRLHGSFAVVAHTPQAPLIHLLASDQSGHDRRALQIWSATGDLQLQADGFVYRDSDGHMLDQARDLLAEQGMAHQMAAQIGRIIAPAPGTTPTVPAHMHQALACALACQLSARTGQPESPRRLLSMTSA